MFYYVQFVFEGCEVCDKICLGQLLAFALKKVAELLK
jgi:hypothetical protein